MATATAKWSVVMLDDGQVVVHGPIQNKVMTLGALAEAANAVDRWHQQQQGGPQIEIAGAGSVPAAGVH